MPLKDRIAEAIEGSEKSKAEIARACDVTNAAVTHWLNGETVSLKADKALALELATGFRAHWILSGRGSKRADEPYWPFASIAISRFTELNDKQQGFVEARLLQAIEECEANKQATRVLRRFGVTRESMSDEEAKRRLAQLPPGEAEAAKARAAAKRTSAPRRKTNFNLQAPPQDDHGSNDDNGIQDQKNAGPIGGGRRTSAKR